MGGGDLLQLGQLLSDPYHNPNWVEKIEEGIPVGKRVQNKISHSESHDFVATQTLTDTT